MIAEVRRLAEDATREKNWKRWGPISSSASGPPYLNSGRSPSGLLRRVAQPELPGTLGHQQIRLLHHQFAASPEQTSHALPQLPDLRGTGRCNVGHKAQQPFTTRSLAQLVVGEARHVRQTLVDLPGCHAPAVRDGEGVRRAAMHEVVRAIGPLMPFHQVADAVADKRHEIIDRKST